MKKTICSLMILAFLFSLALPLYGGEEYDAFHVDEEHALEYKFKPDDSAVMIYSGMYFTEFARGTEVYDIIKNSSDDVAYLVTSDNLIQIRYKAEGEVKTAPISCLARACLSQICVMAKSHGRIFDSDTEVINTYIFHEMWGFSIYFVTNKGDFVLYKDSIVTEEIYLLPENVYRECAGSMVDFMKSTEGGSCPGYTYFADLTEYQIYPEPTPDFTDLPVTEDCDTCPATQETPTPETEDLKKTEEPITTPESVQTTESEKDSAGVSGVGVILILVSAAVPTVILGAVIIIILKRK